MSSTTSLHRFTQHSPCPICGGHDRLPRGQGERCHGFLSDDGVWAHCSREEHAGGLHYHSNSNTYAHYLAGDCHCGKQHGPCLPLPYNGHSSQIVAVYDYQDADGTLLYQSVRKFPKAFYQQRPDSNGGLSYKLGDVKRVPYRLPHVLAADPSATIYIVEGEKDADQLVALGLIATTNVSGAGKWRSEYNHYFRGRHVVILPDNDGPGRQHSEHVAQELVDTAASVRLVNLPGLPLKGDVSDWLANGGTAQELEQIVASAPLYQPQIEGVTRVASNQANRGNRALVLTSLSDLLAEPAEAIDYVIDGLLITGGVSLLIAKPKVGKSTLARNAGLCVARGQPFLNRLTAEGPVVYLALEEKRTEVRRHFARMDAMEEPIFIHVGSAPQDALEELQGAIATHLPVLAIIDPLFKLVRFRDGNDYTEVSRAMEPLIELARSTGCHLLCVHHQGKGERSGGDAVLGSTALFGAVDTLLVMKRNTDGQRTLETIQRYGEDMPATLMQLDSVTGIISAGGDVALLKLEETESAILNVLSGELLPEIEIRNRVKGNESLTAKALRDLVAKGQVRRNGTGKKGDPYFYSVMQDADNPYQHSRFARLAIEENQQTKQIEESALGHMASTKHSNPAPLPTLTKINDLIPRITSDKLSFVLNQLPRRGPNWIREYMNKVEGFGNWPLHIQQAVQDAEAAEEQKKRC